MRLRWRGLVGEVAGLRPAARAAPTKQGSVGKVTFRAVASINAGRDALPGDNELIAPATTVNT